MTGRRIHLTTHQATDETHITDPLRIEAQPKEARPLESVGLGQTKGQEEKESGEREAED